MMNPNESVRVKYVYDDEIICRTTAGVVPRRNECVLIHEEDETGVPENRQKYIVESVIWKVANTPERKPDVVTVDLQTFSERREEHRELRTVSRGE